MNFPPWRINKVFLLYSIKKKRKEIQWAMEREDGIWEKRREGRKGLLRSDLRASS